MCKKNILHLLIIMIISIILMAVVDSYVQPGYLTKSIIKIFLFLIIPVLYALKIGNLDLISFFHIKSLKQIKNSLILGLGIYGIIEDLYSLILTKPLLDQKHMELVPLHLLSIM